MLLALSVATSLLAAAPTDMPLPALKEADIETTATKEEPGKIVDAPDGSFYVLRTAEGPAKWPVVFVDRYDHNGRKQWTHEHEIPRAGSGKGFRYFEGAGTDTAGNLLFGYNSTYEAFHDHLVKLRTNGTVAWETRLDDCGYAKEVLARGHQDVLLGCARHGDTYVARYAASDGAMVWSKRSQSTGKSERGFAAAFDKDKNIVVVRDWGKSTNNLDAGIKLAKFTPDGELLWSKTSKLSGSYYSGGLPKLVDAFTHNNDTIAVFGVTSEKVIEVHRYDGNGNLLVRDVIDTKQTPSERIFASYGIVDNMYTLVVAWDDTNEPHDGEIGVAAVRFKRVKKPKFSTTKSGAGSGKKFSRSPSKPAKAKAHAVQQMTWEVTHLPETRIATDDHLVDLDIGDGRPWIAAVDVGSRDRVRITAIPTLHGRSATSSVYGPQGRHYRPVALHVGKHNLVHVLGTAKGSSGPNTTADADVMRLAFWANRPNTPKAASHNPSPLTKKSRPKAGKKKSSKGLKKK